MDLQDAREALDRIDAQIAALFCERMAVVDQVAAWKAANGMAVRQPQREQEVFTRLLARQDAGYQKELAALYACIFELSRSRQEAVIAGDHPLGDEV